MNWVETSPYNPYDPDYGNRFNATAKYSGTYSSSYAKGYAYEVKYYGTVEKDEIEGYSCTLLFAPEFEDLSLIHISISATTALRMSSPASQ